MNESEWQVPTPWWHHQHPPSSLMSPCSWGGLQVGMMTTMMHPNPASQAASCGFLVLPSKQGQWWCHITSVLPQWQWQPPPLLKAQDGGVILFHWVLTSVPQHTSSLMSLQGGLLFLFLFSRHHPPSLLKFSTNELFYSLVNPSLQGEFIFVLFLFLFFNVVYTDYL